jgi:hypothetical protein
MTVPGQKQTSALILKADMVGVRCVRPLCARSRLATAVAKPSPYQAFDPESVSVA